MSKLVEGTEYVMDKVKRMNYRDFLSFFDKSKLQKLQDKIVPKSKKENIDKELARQVSSLGGVYPYADYNKVANGYMTTLTIYKYVEQPQALWLLRLINKYRTEDNEVIIKIDIEPYNANEIKSEINNSINEGIDKTSTATHGTDVLDAQKDIGNLKSLYQAIANNNEKVVNVQIRFFIFNKVLKELYKKVDMIKKELELDDYKSMTMLGRMQEDYLNLTSTNVQLKQPIPSSVLASGFPFSNVSFEDKDGQFLGLSPTGGAVVVNTKLITRLRTSFDMWIFGDKGTGKTTFLKDYIIECLLRRDRVIFIDIEKQLPDFVLKFAGKVIDYSKKEFAYNFMQMLKVSNSSTFDEDWRFHLSKLKGQFRNLLGDPTESNISALMKVCKQVYMEYGYFDEVRDNDLEVPILEDVVNLMSKVLKERNTYKSIFSNNTIEHFEKLIDMLTEYVDKKMYGDVFNIRTHYDLQNEQFIVFDVSSVRRDDAKLKQAQMYNMNNILYNEMLKNEGNEHHLVIIYDEARNFVGPTVQDEHLEIIEIMVSEDRKYSTQLVFATQSIRDIFMLDVKDERAERLKRILEQSTYRIYFRMDNSAINVISKIYPHIPMSYLNEVTKFGKGDALIDIENTMVLQFHHDMTEEQLALYECKKT